MSEITHLEQFLGNYSPVCYTCGETDIARVVQQPGELTPSLSFCKQCDILIPDFIFYKCLICGHTYTVLHKDQYLHDHLMLGGVYTMEEVKYLIELLKDYPIIDYMNGCDNCTT